MFSLKWIVNLSSKNRWRSGVCWRESGWNAEWNLGQLRIVRLLWEFGESTATCRDSSFINDQTASAQMDWSVIFVLFVYYEKELFPKIAIQWNKFKPTILLKLNLSILQIFSNRDPITMECAVKTVMTSRTSTATVGSTAIVDECHYCSAADSSDFWSETVFRWEPNAWTALMATFTVATCGPARISSNI